MSSIVFRTPFGWVGAAASDKGISCVVLPKKNKKAVERELVRSESGVRSVETFPLTPALSREGRGLLAEAVKLLEEYFSGENISFDLPLNLREYTPFQQAVWRACADIPAGETRSYAWIAKRIRKPLAARAVGQAMGANPVPILVP